MPANEEYGLAQGSRLLTRQVNAQIQANVSGYLIRQDYQEGGLVPKGQVLFEIDPRPFQAALDEAKGQLAQAEGQTANAEMNVKRDIPEAEAHAIPQASAVTKLSLKPAQNGQKRRNQRRVETALSDGWQRDLVGFSFR
jgi:multidrug resistance efflux pump